MTGSGAPDLLDHGGPDRPGRPRRRWPLVLTGALVAVALLAYGAVRLAGPHATRAAGPAPSTGSPSASALPPGTAAGPCGPVALPEYGAGPLRTRTGLRVLTGGPVLTRLDLDTGDRTVLFDPVRTGDRGAAVVQVAVADGRTYVRLGSCATDLGAVYVLDGRTAPRLLVHGRVGPIMTGGGGTLVPTYPRGPGGPVLVLRLAADVRRAFALPVGSQVAGVLADGVVVARTTFGSGRSPALSLVDPDSGRVVRRLGRGVPLATGRHALVWVRSDGCRLPGEGVAVLCAVHSTDLGGRAGRTRRPDEVVRLPTNLSLGPGAAAVDDTGRRLAFLVDRNPAGPGGGLGGVVSEVLVLDLHRHRLAYLPGFRLPASPGLPGTGFAFARHGGPLVVSLGEGERGHLLVWRPETRRVYVAATPITGPLGTRPPVALAP